MNKNRKMLSEILGLLIAAAYSAVQFTMLQFSCVPETYIKHENIGFFTPISLINVLIVLCVNLLFRFCMGKWGTAVFASSIFMTIWSIANYYTVLYHGAPLFISELRSAGTALDVIGGYQFKIGKVVALLIFTGVMLAAAAIFLMILNRKSRRYSASKLIRTLALLAACIGIVYVFLYSDKKIKPVNTMKWSWTAGVSDYGFAACAVEDVEKTIHCLNVPEGYSADLVKEYELENIEGTAQQYPDIILILNESFYCMEDYLKTGADRDYMEGFYGIENAVYGHAVVTSIGGGTNNSEFEYLTGNSMALMKNYAPFNYYDFTANQDNYVQYLKGLGYTSAAFHCAKPTNYRRNIVYPQLGFDEVLLGADNFNHHDFQYGKRKWTDSDNYKDLIDHYNGMSDAPRFLYMLTYQGHGGYEKNGDELDVVHVTEDFGEYTDDLNEYLSSVYYSGLAFREITEYYSNVDRPVIICMVGDHAPSLIKRLEDKEYSKYENSVKSRTVPYAIWSNIDLDTTEVYTENTTMFELTAMILKMSGMPMTTYQKQILDLHQEMPVLTSDGLCMDRDGTIVPYEESPAKDTVNKYYYMEYNSLKHDKDYREELFKLK